MIQCVYCNLSHVWLYIAWYLWDKLARTDCNHKKNAIGSLRKILQTWHRNLDFQAEAQNCCNHRLLIISYILATWKLIKVINIRTGLTPVHRYLIWLQFWGLSRQVFTPHPGKNKSIPNRKWSLVTPSDQSCKSLHCPKCLNPILL